MSAKNIWTAGISGSALVSIIGMLAILPKMEFALKRHIEKALAEAGVLNEIDIRVSGQDVILMPRLRGDDSKESILTAKKALAMLKIPNMPEMPYGHWLIGPIAAISIDSDHTQTDSIGVSTSLSSLSQDVFDPKSGLDRKGAAKACEASLAKTLIEHKIAYRFSVYQLNMASQVSVAEIYKAISNCPTEVRFIVLGHTDAVGKTEVNRLISLARAEAVANSLIEHGLSKERISFEGRGSAEPVDNNTTYRGRARNRRVSFKVSVQ